MTDLFVSERKKIGLSILDLTGFGGYEMVTIWARRKIANLTGLLVARVVEPYAIGLAGGHEPIALTLLTSVKAKLDKSMPRIDMYYGPWPGETEAVCVSFVALDYQTDLRPVRESVDEHPDFYRPLRGDPFCRFDRQQELRKILSYYQTRKDQPYPAAEPLQSVYPDLIWGHISNGCVVSSRRGVVYEM